MIDVTVRSSLDTPNGDTAMGLPTDKTGRDLEALPKDNQYRIKSGRLSKPPVRYGFEH